MVSVKNVQTRFFRIVMIAIIVILSGSFYTGNVIAQKKDYRQRTKCLYVRHRRAQSAVEALASQYFVSPRDNRRSLERQYISYHSIPLKRISR